MKRFLKYVAVVGSFILGSTLSASESWAEQSRQNVVSLQVATIIEGKEYVVTLTGPSKQKLRDAAVAMDTGLKSKDAALKEMTEFGECAGFFAALADEVARGIGEKSTGDLAKGYSDQYEFVGRFFGRIYSTQYAALLKKVKHDAFSYYSGRVTTNERSFGTKKEMSTRCFEKIFLEELIIKFGQEINSK